MHLEDTVLHFTRWISAYLPRYILIAVALESVDNIGSHTPRAQRARLVRANRYCVREVQVRGCAAPAYLRI